MNIRKRIKEGLLFLLIFVVGVFSFSACNKPRNILQTSDPDDFTFELKDDDTYEVTSYVGTGAISVSIPGTFNEKAVTSIGEGAFRRCESLVSITIPSSVTSIEKYAFASCDSLVSITIPSSVTSIGEGAFRWCESLVSITIPSGVTSIGDSVFASCKSLIHITIPGSVTSIGKDAFLYCELLQNATFENAEGWRCSESVTATDGTNIASSDLEDVSTAATYLRDTYAVYYWQRG